MEATGRLRRLLYLVPAVLARQGVPVAELAKELDIDEATLREDINLLSMVGPPQGGPDEFLLLTIDEEDVVRGDALDASVVREQAGVVDEAEQTQEQLPGFASVRRTRRLGPFLLAVCRYRWRRRYSAGFPRRGSTMRWYARIRSRSASARARKPSRMRAY